MTIKNNIVTILLTLLLILSSTSTLADTKLYFIRHAEVDLNTKKKLLTEAGKKRAQSLVKVMKGIQLNHILVTDYPRTKNTAGPLSQDRKLDIEVIPYKGKKAINPMVKKLKELPDGSAVLIVANSGNLFQIMSKMGVSTNRSMPCKSKKCFDRQAFDNMWHVTISGNQVDMKGTKY